MNLHEFLSKCQVLVFEVCSTKSIFDLTFYYKLELGNKLYNVRLMVTY